MELPVCRIRAPSVEGRPGGGNGRCSKGKPCGWHTWRECGDNSVRPRWLRGCLRPSNRPGSATATFASVLWVGLALPGLPLLPGLGASANSNVAISLSSAVLGVQESQTFKATSGLTGRQARLLSLLLPTDPAAAGLATRRPSEADAPVGTLVVALPEPPPTPAADNPQGASRVADTILLASAPQQQQQQQQQQLPPAPAPSAPAPPSTRPAGPSTPPRNPEPPASDPPRRRPRRPSIPTFLQSIRRHLPAAARLPSRRERRTTDQSIRPRAIRPTRVWTAVARTQAEATPTQAEAISTPAEATRTPAEATRTLAEVTPTPAEAIRMQAAVTPTQAEATPTQAEATPTPAEATPTPAEATRTRRRQPQRRRKRQPERRRR